MKKILLYICSLSLLLAFQACDSAGKKEESIEESKLEAFASSHSWAELVANPEYAQTIKQADQFMKVDKMLENYAEKELTITETQKVKIYLFAVQQMQMGIGEANKMKTNAGDNSISEEEKQELFRESRKELGQRIYKEVFTVEQKQYLKTLKEKENP